MDMNRFAHIGVIVGTGGIGTTKLQEAAEIKDLIAANVQKTSKSIEEIKQEVFEINRLDYPDYNLTYSVPMSGREARRIRRKQERKQNKKR